MMFLIKVTASVLITPVIPFSLLTESFYTKNMNLQETHLEQFNEIEKRIIKIHYINNLWHISLLLGKRPYIDYLLTRKNELQNELMLLYHDRIELVLDTEISAHDPNKKYYSIKIPDLDKYACHIPDDKICKAARVIYRID